MAIHNVYLELPSREITKVDAHFEIYKDASKLGRITISKGGIDYYTSNSKKPIKITWTQFDKLMKECKGK